MKSLTIILLGLGCLTLGFILIPEKITHEKFDSKTWKEWEESEWTASLRWDMMNSLRNNYNLKGMSEDEILELLGIPEQRVSNSFIYYLGYTKTGINTGSLYIEFDSNKSVNNFHVWQG